MKKSKIISILIFVTLLLQYNFPAMIANESGKGFLPGTPKTAAETIGSPSINQCIIEGGGYYLKSYSDFLLFLNKVEMSELNGMNYEEALRVVNSAVANLENARLTYFRLTNLADATPYDPSIIDRLLNFDYPALQTSGNLSPNLFKAVEGFLGKGDIRGVYHKLLADVSDISGQLYKIKAGLEKNELPAVSGLWNTHQHYSDSIFFGQYVAAVFFEIK